MLNSFKRLVQNIPEIPENMKRHKGLGFRTKYTDKGSSKSSSSVSSSTGTISVSVKSLDERRIRSDTSNEIVESAGKPRFSPYLLKYHKCMNLYYRIIENEVHDVLWCREGLLHPKVKPNVWRAGARVTIIDDQIRLHVCVCVVCLTKEQGNFSLCL